MKVNVIADEGGIIRGWLLKPFDESKPWAEIDDPNRIRIGIDRFDGKDVSFDDEAYAKAMEASKAFAESLGKGA